MKRSWTRQDNRIISGVTYHNREDFIVGFTTAPGNLFYVDMPVPPGSYFADTRRDQQKSKPTTLILNAAGPIMRAITDMHKSFVERVSFGCPPRLNFNR